MVGGQNINVPSTVIVVMEKLAWKYVGMNLLGRARD